VPLSLTRLHHHREDEVQYTSLSVVRRVQPRYVQLLYRGTAFIRALEVSVSKARPYVIILGGAPGTGKTTLSRRLAAQLRLPRLGADTIGRTIKASPALTDQSITAYWLAYDVLFRLCDEFLQSNVSHIVDVNLGWAFQWQHIDAMKHRYPRVIVLPIVLQCSRAMCLERIRARHAANPSYYDPPELFTTDAKFLRIWAFLEALDRPGVHRVNAAQELEDVYADITDYMRQRLTQSK
jgi:adenylate kinase family enzyme